MQTAAIAAAQASVEAVMSEPLKPQQEPPRANEPPTDRDREAKPERPSSADTLLSPNVTTHPSIKNN